MFIGLRRSERLKEKLYPRYHNEFKICLRQIIVLSSSFPNIDITLSTTNFYKIKISFPNIDITLSTTNFYKIKINKMIDIMKLYTKSIALLLHFSSYQSGLKLMKQIYKKTFEWKNDIKQLTAIGDLELGNKDIRKLEKYLNSFRKYYKQYRYNNWESIINNNKHRMDEYIINKIDEYL